MTYEEYRRNPHRLGYNMSLHVGQSQPKPSVILLKDSLILAELFGAGFTKAPGGKVRSPPIYTLCLLTDFEPVLRASLPKDDENVP